MSTTKRFYLNCPYAEKDEARELGARWDAKARKWFVPDGIDTNIFRKWWPGEVAAGKPRFPDNDELRDLLEHIAERIDGLEEALNADQEPDLYVAPLTPLEQYEEEIIDCREWHGNAPEPWKQIFRKDVDIEALAFYMLPEETRDQLTN